MSASELEPALDWIFGMQNSDGGWGTFDRDNNQIILNRIPFADLKSLIDPSNPDVTGHVLETLGDLGLGHLPEARAAVRYLKKVQKPDGSWFGRWGVNYLYGTCAAVVGLRRIGEPAMAAYLQRALEFVLAKQNADGGWGERCGSYGVNAAHGEGESTPSQTAWALMTLHAMKDGYRDCHPAIARALQFLESRKSDDGLFEEEFTGTGFPQHFYLRYDGYRTYFPLIALGRVSKNA
jgi:squalene-hopene/tetraprenyl-beta-curcumene cyclase